MKIIVGLGNIGEKYTETRHNAGFIALDFIIKQFENETGKKIELNEAPKIEALIANYEYRQQKIIFAKPTTLMNLSGIAIQKILNFYKASTSDLIVVYDDIDIGLGEIRVRIKGSAGTHNGMKSVINELGTENFTRIRIGIENRCEEAEKMDLGAYVLQKFTSEEKNVLIRNLNLTLMPNLSKLL